MQDTTGTARSSQASRAGSAPHVSAPQAAERDLLAGQAGAASLLAVESKIRSARDETELTHLIANELRRLIAGRQAIVFKAKKPGEHKVMSVSSLVLSDKDTPFVRWVERIVAEIVREHGGTQAVTFELPAFADKESPETRSYPFGHLVWQPLHLVSGMPFASVLIARERAWSEQDRLIIAREAGVCASAWQALYGEKSLRPAKVFSHKTRWLLAAGLALAALVPVPMSTLAPVEIVAARPQRVTAPIDGVVKEILVEPNLPVKSGQPILRFDETTLRNRLLLADQEMRVAAARHDRTTQASFGDDKARHDVAQARAEFDLKKAERDYAADLLEKTVVVAERDGVLLYSDKDRWIGRPVKTGERIMQIVAPDQIAARVELAVADSIFLERGANVRLFMDANPLSAVHGKLVSEGYQAEVNSSQQLVYRLFADLDEGGAGLRIGARGTAQLQGSLVPLAYYLLRRPIAGLRQHLGL